MGIELDLERLSIVYNIRVNESESECDRARQGKSQYDI